ncbi:PAS domain S-box protein [Mucilaginibacter sp. ZT4R22]|uniref:histidine kinase n=1 Tax=Mucilaginibacter pankratovii TaxID=2772110 RepID=A0ABR7WWV1_9SPHI|nr:PAS domain S-box protein [Mucilaginibacter pankratovii]MBD1366765.1 PAS domain S-box protein [Mucilaginibacter pankratovii]
MQITDGADLHNAVLYAPIGICILNADTLVAEIVNDKFLEVAGKPYEAIHGHFYWDTFAEARPYYEAAVAGVVASGEPYHADEVKLMLVRHGREETIFVTFVYAPVKDEAGKLNKVAVWVLENTKQVNERQAAGAAFQKERDLLHAFFMQAPAGICILSGPNLVYELVNPGYEQLLPGRELLNRPIFEALPELVGTPLQEIVWNVYHTGKPYEVNELLVPLADEEGGPVRDRYFSFNYLPRRNQNNEVDGIIAFVYDVTSIMSARLNQLDKNKQLTATNEEQAAFNEELAATNEELATTNEELAATNDELNAMQQRLEDANQELATSTSRLRMAIESTKLGTWDYDPQTGALYWSQECRDIYGIPPNQPATFATFSDHIHPDDHDWVQAAIAQAIHPEKGGRYELNFRINRFDNGETRWIKVHGKVYFEEGVATRFIGTVLDITDMKVAEEQSAKLAAIIQSSDDAIISKTFESVITSWNDSAERVFGYTAEEMIGESIYKLIPPDRYEEEPRILATIRTGERVDHFETQRLTKDGRLIDVSVTVSPVKDNLGNIIGLSKIARDITEKKLDETRKGDFIGMVSHELKTPLTSLGAIIQVANAKLKNSEDTFLSGAMQKANHHIKRMTAMINGFLNISRLESGKIHIEKQDFDMETLISDVIEEANLTVTTHLIHFVQCPPITVRADRDKIGSVISNFISNAVKYSPKGNNIAVACSATDTELIVSVKDEGMGIKPGDLEKIFDRYYRVETTHTRHISGFGIGLYLSSEIIQRHGGRVWAESQSGVGSTFYFSLPL